MAQEPLVGMLIEDGRRLLDQLAEEGAGVTAACWLRGAEDGHWSFYIATPLVGAEGRTRDAYRRVHEVIRRMPEPPQIGPLVLNLISPKDAVAAAVQELHRRYPGNYPVHYGSLRFGGKSVDGAYVYPPIPAAVR